MGAFDDSADGGFLSGRTQGGLSLGFTETFGLQFETMRRQSQVFSLGDAYKARAKTILEVTGNPDYYIKALQTSDPKNQRLIDDLATQYPDRIKRDKDLIEGLRVDNQRFMRERDTAMQFQTTGGMAGTFLGAMAGTIAYDPAMWLSIPLGATGASTVLRRALAEAGINIAAEGASIAASAKWRQRIDDEIKASEIGLRLGVAGVAGFGVGAGAQWLKKLSEARKIIESRPVMQTVAEAATPKPAATAQAVDLSEMERVLQGRPLGEQPTTVRELSRILDEQLALADHVRKSPESLDALRREYARLDPTNDQLQLENVLLEHDRYVATKLDELKNLPRRATSAERQALEKEIEDATFYQEVLNEQFLAARSRAVNDPGVSLEERDAANMLDDWGEILQTNPFKYEPDGIETHVRALGKAIDDIDNGRPVDVKEVLGTKGTLRDDIAPSPAQQKQIDEFIAENRIVPPDDFPDSPTPKATVDKLDTEMAETYKDWENELDDLLKKNPEALAGIKVGDSELSGSAKEIIEALRTEESQIAAVKACMMRGSE